MNIFITGATGALGTHLVPLLVERGHVVTGMTTTKDKQQLLYDMGARPVVGDALDPDSVAGAVAAAEPEVVVHQATALSAGIDLRHAERTFAMTNRLRTEGTDYLVAAARAVGARRFVAQSYAGWPLGRTGGAVKTEEDPFDPSPPAAMATSLAAIRHIERATQDYAGEGVVLRYGAFYGPGTSISSDPEADMYAQLRGRKVPLVGDGGGVWSFVHIEDAARATTLAIEDAAPGVYQVVDDEPALVREWLPALAAAVGAAPPRRVPRWLGRLAAGEAAVAMMTEVRGASNKKARQELGWEPLYPTWRRGFTEGLA